MLISYQDLASDVPKESFIIEIVESVLPIMVQIGQTWSELGLFLGKEVRKRCELVNKILKSGIFNNLSWSMSIEHLFLQKR